MKEVPLHITVESLEEVSTVAYVVIFGSSDAPLVRLLLQGVRLTLALVTAPSPNFFIFPKLKTEYCSTAFQ